MVVYSAHWHEVDEPCCMPCNIQQHKNWYNTLPHKPHWHLTRNSIGVAFLSCILALALL